MSLSSKEVILERLSICKECPSFQSTIKLCKECGCFVPIKVLPDTSGCPLNKWLPVPGAVEDPVTPAPDNE